MLHLRYLAIGCLALAGCGRSYDGPQRLPLSGKVTFDGEPVDLGSISFIPESDKHRVSGGPIENGIYTVTEERGANAGKYRVEIHWNKKTGKKYHDSYLNETLDERKEGLPPKFNTESTLTVDVSADKTTLDFDLKSK